MKSEMLLYKYTNHYGVDVLRNLELKITPFNQLNDPFEITPFAKELSEEEARQELKRPNAREAAKQNPHLAPYTNNEGEWNRCVDQLPLSDVRKVIRNRSEIPKKIIHDASTKFGMLCLSQRSDSVLMWSHYSNGHQGMVIGIETTEVPRSDEEFFPVNYAPDNARVEWSPFQTAGDLGFHRYALELPRTKGLDWKYENEWRCIYSLNQENVTPRSLCSGGIGYFLKIPAVAIKEIALGYRCPVETESVVKHLTKRNGLTVKLQKVDIYQTSRFEIRFAELNSE